MEMQRAGLSNDVEWWQTRNGKDSRFLMPQGRLRWGCGDFCQHQQNRADSVAADNQKSRNKRQEQFGTSGKAISLSSRLAGQPVDRPYCTKCDTAHVIMRAVRDKISPPAPSRRLRTGTLIILVAVK